MFYSSQNKNNLSTYVVILRVNTYTHSGNTQVRMYISRYLYKVDVVFLKLQSKHMRSQTYFSRQKVPPNYKGRVKRCPLDLDSIASIEFLELSYVLVLKCYTTGPSFQNKFKNRLKQSDRTKQNFVKSITYNQRDRFLFLFLVQS